MKISQLWSDEWTWPHFNENNEFKVTIGILLLALGYLEKIQTWWVEETHRYSALLFLDRNNLEIPVLFWLTPGIFTFSIFSIPRDIPCPQPSSLMVGFFFLNSSFHLLQIVAIAKWMNKVSVQKKSNDQISHDTTYLNKTQI